MLSLFSRSADEKDASGCKEEVWFGLSLLKQTWRQSRSLTETAKKYQPSANPGKFSAHAWRWPQV